jgi:hypothetical protein
VPAFNTQQDLLDYIERLEARITKLEQSSVRIDKTSSRASLPASQTRIIYDTSTNKLYAGDGSAWNALW